MASLPRFWIQAQSFLLSFFGRSFKTHASVRVSDLTQSLAFYRMLGFRKVTSSRGDEVILLRNHRGDELNIVPGIPALSKTNHQSESHVSFRVEDLEQDLTHLRSWHPDLDIIDDAMTRRVLLTDPDANIIEFYEQLDRNSLTGTRVYHLATLPELNAGLSEHYYLPPDEENRFVRARARSAFLALACKRVAEGAKATPLIIEMDESELSIESQLFDDEEFDSASPDTRSAYPRVNSPIPRHAITTVGICEEKDGDFPWPTRFVTVDSITAGIV